MNLEFKSDLEELYKSSVSTIDNTYNAIYQLGKTAYYSTKLIAKTLYKITYEVFNYIYHSDTLRRLYRKVKEYDYKNLWDKLKKIIIGSCIALSLLSVVPATNTYANCTTQKSILIDLAHLDTSNGTIKDNGAMYGSYTEREIVNEISLLLGEKLQLQGYNIKYTRNYNESMSINDRIKLANSQNNDFYISLHANSSKKQNNGGVEVYCTRGGDGEVLAKEITNNISSQFNMNNRGVKDDIYYTRYIKDTAIIAELGFINNDYDRQKMIDNKDRFADVLAQSINNTYVAKDITSFSYQHQQKPQKIFDMKMVDGEWKFIEIN